MTIKAPADATPSLRGLVEDIQREIDLARSPFISQSTYTVAELTTALAASFPWKMAVVTDGAASKFVAISNGTQFFYLQGTAV